MEDPSSQNLLLQFVLLFILTVLNAFFSATEMAMVSLNRARVEQKAEEGDRRYIRLLKVLENPNHFLSTIQVGITLITILSGASLADTLGREIASWLGDGETAYAVASFLSLAFLTYISIVFGELYPKRIALNLKDTLAIRTAPVIIGLGKLVNPFVWLLSASTNLLSRLTPVAFDDADEKMTRDEIEYMLTNSEETLDADEIEMLQGIFSLDELMAREVMVPRTDAFMVDIQDDSQTIIQSILKQNYSRIPVYDGDKDNVIGIIHTKSLLKAGFVDGFDNIAWKKILQDPLFVPETIFVDDLLKELRNTETDKAEIEVHQIGEDTYIVQGTMNLNDFNDYFDVELASDDVDTIAGYYLTGVGTIPTTEKLSYELVSQNKQLILTNDKVKNGRVTKVKVQITEVEIEEETE